MFFTFPEDADWNTERQAVEFGVEIGEYRGVVTVPQRVFQRLFPERPSPESARGGLGLGSEFNGRVGGALRITNAFITSHNSFSFSTNAK